MATNVAVPPSARTRSAASWHSRGRVDATTDAQDPTAQLAAGKLLHQERDTTLDLNGAIELRRHHELRADGGLHRRPVGALQAPSSFRSTPHVAREREL